jgi:hypothetical protein
MTTVIWSDGKPTTDHRQKTLTIQDHQPPVRKTPPLRYTQMPRDLQALRGTPDMGTEE